VLIYTRININYNRLRPLNCVQGCFAFDDDDINNVFSMYCVTENQSQKMSREYSFLTMICMSVDISHSDAKCIDYQFSVLPRSSGVF